MKKYNDFSNESWIKITPDNYHELEIGRRVKQPVLGEGEIISIRPDGAIVKIKFDEKGEKNIRIDVADLEVEDKNPYTPIIKWWNKGELEEKNNILKMENLKDFDTFNEEFMYRHDPSTRPARYKKQKQYFINQLIKNGCNTSKESLEKMEIGVLGKMLNKIKSKEK